jgi:hypothetical protein
MAKKKQKKLTPAQKRARKRARAKRREMYEWIFINGKQVKVRRPPTIDGMDEDEFIRKNADPIWLHQNEMWEYMPEFDSSGCWIDEDDEDDEDDEAMDDTYRVILNTA